MPVVVEVGSRVVGNTVMIPRDMLEKQEPIHGAIYELEIQTKGIPDPNKVMQVLMEEIPKRFHMKVLWIRVQDPYIRVQVMPNNPVPWALVIALLPFILMFAGVAMVLVSVFVVLSSVPGWVYGLLAVGGILAFGSYMVIKGMTRR